MDNFGYLTYLESLLTNPESSREYQSQVDINIYQTLMNLNHSDPSKYEESELSILEDYLRKLNNLKVKIQLKRKQSEIDTLMQEIISQYERNKLIIDKYNTNNLDITKIVTTKDPQELTTLIDTETKEKLRRINNKNYYDELRIKLNKLLPISKYEAQNDTLFLSNNEENMEVPLNDFYQVFEYLLDIDTYNQPMTNNKANRHRIVMVSEIIKYFLAKENQNNYQIKVAIPLVLSYLTTETIPNIDLIDTSKFKIDNIKISDLYSLAQENRQENSERRATWQKISIPNSYLYQKIKEIILKGTYYFDDDKFILENIEQNQSDFKISISIIDMQEFLKTNILLCKEQATLTK